MVSPEILADVSAVLPDDPPGIRPRDAWKRMQKWSPVSVRNALRHLVSTGHARFQGEDMHRTYWRALGPADTIAQSIRESGVTR